MHSGGLGGQLVIRGFNSNDTRSMLAIDGDRYRGRSTLEFNMIEPFAIERIEVIRGPASALWGSDAMTGVVNIITRRAKADRNAPFSVTPYIRGLEYGSVNNLRAGRAEISGGGNGFDMLLGAHYRAADNYDTPIGKALGSKFDARGFDFRLGYSPTALTRWELAGRYQDVTTHRAGGMGVAPGQPWYKIREEPIQERYLKLGLETREAGKFADLLNASLYVRKLTTDIFTSNAATNLGTLNSETTNVHMKVHTPTVYGGRLNANKAIGSHLLSYGFDFFYEDFKSRTGRASKTNTATGALISQAPGWSPMERGATLSNIGVSVGDDWQITKDLMLSGALRYDWVQTKIDEQPIPGEDASFTKELNRVGLKRTDTALTGSLGAVWQFAPSWAATAQVSRGFRAPSGNARTLTSASGTQKTIPSPGLVPEYNITYEAGLRYHNEGLRLNATAYQSNYKDMMKLAYVGMEAGLPVYQRRNVGKAEVKGVEIDGEWRIAQPWLLRFAATYTVGKDKTENKPLDAIPTLGGRVALRYGAEDAPWYVEGAVRAARERTRIDTKIERKRPGFASVDLYVSADLGKVVGSDWKNWRMTAGVQNLFDKEIVNQAAGENKNYSNHLVGNPLREPGRSFSLKLVRDF